LADATKSVDGWAVTVRMTQSAFAQEIIPPNGCSYWVASLARLDCQGILDGQNATIYRFAAGEMPMRKK